MSFFSIPKWVAWFGALIRLAAVLTILSVAPSVSAQSNFSLFDRALDGIGGRDALLELDRFRVSASGDTFASHMGFMPNDIKRTSSYSRDYMVQLSTWSARTEVTRQFTYEPRHRFPSQQYLIVTVDGVGAVSSGANPLGLPGGALPAQTVAAMEKTMRLVNPHLFLREALEGHRTAKEGETVLLDGQTHRVLIISDDVAPIRLLVSLETNQISRLETLVNSVTMRDSALVVTYVDWRDAGSVWFPTSIEVTIGGNFLRRETLSSVIVSPTMTEKTFSLPVDVVVTPANSEAVRFGQDSFHIHEEFFEIAGLFYAEGAKFATTKLAPGLYLVQDTVASGLSGLAVEHSGGVIMLEAHTSPRAADLFIEAVQTVLPGQPITHLIQSHHHVDHSSGVRSIVAAGATVIVGHGVGDWWQGVLSAESTIRPDSLSLNQVPIIVEELPEGGAWTLSGKDARITAYHVGENSHAQDMVMTKIETDGQIFVFQADLYNAGFGFTMSFDGPQAFFAAMKKHGLIDELCSSEKPLTIIPSHGRPTSLDGALAELASLNLDVGCSP